jgi:hypothetical protein
MEKNISYLNRNFADYKEALIAYSEKYYPDLSNKYDDASVASWLIELMAAVADNESFHIDRVYQETNIDSANELSSLMAIARNNGVKIPGPKGSMAEVRITVSLPSTNQGPDWNYAPVIKRGTKVASGSQRFEVLTDVAFAEQFDENGVSNRTIVPNVNTNGIITGYTVSKLTVVTAGESKVYRQVVHSSDIAPFMEVLLPVENVMNVESIVVLDGTDSSVSPTYGEFYGEGCPESGVTRFYEVNSLSDCYTWTDSIAEPYVYGYSGIPTYSVTKGEWKPIDHKFITEYTDKGYLKIIFGVGVEGGNIEIGSGATAFGKWQMSKILNNKNLGLLPKAESTIYILYRIGGGKASNVARGAINKVVSLNADFRGDDRGKIENVMRSLTVINTTPSVSGKDMPTEQELKYLIKYNKAANDRCVTVKDYIDRILMLPPKYGTPFRVGVMEENNKVMVYLLGLDENGKLDTSLPVALIRNIEDYLSGYRMINDFIEIKSGRIINVSFEVDIIIDKNYNRNDVITEVINTIKDYMDINKHLMGDDIYVGDIEKEISKIDGVLNLIDLRVFNERGEGYSHTEIQQPTYTYSEQVADGVEETHGDDDTSVLIDTDATDGIIYTSGDTMLEVKFDDDIKVRVKER